MKLLPDANFKPTSFPHSGNPLYIGYSGNYFKGAIDDVRIYNRVLTQAEVTALYNE